MSKKELFKSWDWKLVSAVVFFLSTRAALIFVYDHYWSDTPIYRDAAAALLKGHYIPYRDFWFPYPPLSIPIVAIPFLAAEGMTGYRTVFQLEMFIFDAITLVYIILFLRRVKASIERQAAAIALYAVFGLALGHLVYDRIDIAIAAVFASIAYHLSSPDSSPGKRLREWRMARCANVVGALIKIVPLLILPVHVVVEFFNDTSKSPGQRILSAAKPALWIAVPFIVLMFFCEKATFNDKRDAGMLSIMAEHGARGIQMESTWATPFMLRNATAVKQESPPPYPILTNYGAQHLDSERLPRGLLPLAKYAGFALLATLQLGVGVWLLARPASRGAVKDPVWILEFVTACLLTTLASQRVFSPQYVVWLLPMAATLPFARRGFDWKVAFPLCGIVFLTFLEFDRGNYEGLRRFETASVVSVAARNALCVSAAAFFALRLFKWKANLPIDEVEHSKKESI
jgi:hypothetical protein